MAREILIQVYHKEERAAGSAWESVWDNNGYWVPTDVRKCWKTGTSLKPWIEKRLQKKFSGPKDIARFLCKHSEQIAKQLWA